MPGSAGGDQQEKRPEPPELRHSDGTVDQRNPHERHGHDLSPPWDSAVFPEIADVTSQLRLRQQPTVQPLAAPAPECGGEQQERSRREHRQEDSDNTQRQRQAAQQDQQHFHRSKNNDFPPNASDPTRPHPAAQRNIRTFSRQNRKFDLLLPSHRLVIA